jgi:hypothetical protein
LAANGGRGGVGAVLDLRYLPVRRHCRGEVRLFDYGLTGSVALRVYGQFDPPRPLLLRSPAIRSRSASSDANDGGCVFASSSTSSASVLGFAYQGIRVGRPSRLADRAHSRDQHIDARPRPLSLRRAGRHEPERRRSRSRPLVVARCRPSHEAWLKPPAGARKPSVERSRIRPGHQSR